MGVLMLDNYMRVLSTVLLLSFLITTPGCGTNDVVEPDRQEQQETQINGADQQEAETIEEPVIEEPVIEEPVVEPETKEYNIVFNAEYLGNRRFKVEGTTDLPDGSQLDISIRDIDYYKYDDADDDWRFENLTSIGAFISSSNGKFSTTITSNEMIAPLNSTQYTVEVSFNPRKQTDEIKILVGPNGEYLDGVYLDKRIEGLVMLRASIVISLEP
jgi:hypothetical protein